MLLLQVFIIIIIIVFRTTVLLVVLCDAMIFDQTDLTQNLKQSTW